MRRWPSPCRAAAPGPRAACLRPASACRTRRGGASLLGGQARDVVVVELPVGDGAPAQRRLHRGARRGRRLEQPQRQLQREGLRLRRRAAGRRHCRAGNRRTGSAARRRARRCPWRTPSPRWRCRWPPAHAQPGSRSGGRPGSWDQEHRRIDAVGLAARHHLAAIDVDRDPMAAVGGQRRESARASAPMRPPRARTPQRRQREARCRCLGRGVRAVDRHVR